MWVSISIPDYIAIAMGKVEATEESREGAFFVSKFLDEIATVRDVDAKELFPRQYTSIDKKRDRAIGNGHSSVSRIPAGRLLDKDGRESSASVLSEIDA